MHIHFAFFSDTNKLHYTVLYNGEKKVIEIEFENWQIQFHFDIIFLSRFLKCYKQIFCMNPIGISYITSSVWYMPSFGK